MKIGVLSESFKLPIDEVIKKSVELGIQGIQGYAPSGELSPQALTSEDRKQLLKKMYDNNLVFSALCGDLGGHGFQLADENEDKIAQSCKIVDLAADLETPVVTTHIGVIPDDTISETYTIMQRACYQLGNYAASRGVVFGIETGPETPEALRIFLDSIGSKGLGVNYDPANLVMVQNLDPVKGVYILADYIVHTHAKDGIHLQDCDPVEVYDAFARSGIAGFDFGVLFNETPLGEGAVDWPAYIKALQNIKYNGFLTIEREVGENPIDDIAAAAAYLQRLLTK
ncbi:MAG: sugar phosphate isomerase/epimerase [Spirochaetia bacterium]|nr:sugar phosphate isomerase/epimerase [Spirochaetia bacterium]